MRLLYPKSHQLLFLRTHQIWAQVWLMEDMCYTGKLFKNSRSQKSTIWKCAFQEVEALQFFDTDNPVFAI